MKKYRKRPVVIEAMQFVEENVPALESIEDLDISVLYYSNKLESAVLYTLEGKMKASIDDYIIRGIDGEYYPCKKHIFEKTYSKV